MLWKWGGYTLWRLCPHLLVTIAKWKTPVPNGLNVYKQVHFWITCWVRAMVHSDILAVICHLAVINIFGPIHTKAIWDCACYQNYPQIVMGSFSSHHTCFLTPFSHPRITSFIPCHQGKLVLERLAWLATMYETLALYQWRSYLLFCLFLTTVCMQILFLSLVYPQRNTSEKIMVLPGPCN